MCRIIVILIPIVIIGGFIMLKIGTIVGNYLAKFDEV